MIPNDLQVWVVSQDECLLRDATWGLSNFEFRVSPFREFISLESMWGFSQPDLLLVDVAHPELSNITCLFQNDNRNFIYPMLMIDPNRPTDHLTGLKGAYHDAIGKPLNGGEMLTRIRACVRFLEFERRMHELALVDRNVELLTRYGLLLRMERELESLNNEDQQEFVLVTVRLDYLNNLVEGHGSQNVNRLSEEVCHVMAEIAADEEWTARLQLDEFAIVVPDSSDEEGEAIAMLLRERLESHGFELHGLPLRLTATYCISVWNPMEKQFQEVLGEAERTLEWSRAEGGDAIVRSGEFDPTIAAWEEDNWAGVDITNLTARDVMQPFITEWSESDTSRMSLDTIRNSGIQFVPYLDEEDRYQGILGRDALEVLVQGNVELENESFSSAVRSLLSDLVKSPTTVQEDLPYVELMGYFTEDEKQTLVVLRGNQPLGYIKQDVISALLEPIDICSYRTDKTPSHQSDYVLVPDMPTVYESPPTAVK